MQSLVTVWDLDITRRLFLDRKIIRLHAGVTEKTHANQRFNLKYYGRLENLISQKTLHIVYILWYHERELINIYVWDVCAYYLKRLFVFICTWLFLMFKWLGRINYKIFRKGVSNLNSSVETSTQYMNISLSDCAIMYCIVCFIIITIYVSLTCIG